MNEENPSSSEIKVSNILIVKFKGNSLISKQETHLKLAKCIKSAVYFYPCVIKWSYRSLSTFYNNYFITLIDLLIPGVLSV